MVQSAAENPEEESTAKADLCDRSDVINLVSTFYHRAFADPLLGPVFLDVARMDLAKHMPIMADFWETVLFRAGLYRRNALAVHLDLNAKVELTAGHFDRWLELWTGTVDDLYAGEKAELAKLQAGRIAGSIHRRVRGKSPSDLTTISSIRPAAFQHAANAKPRPEDSGPGAPGRVG